MTQSKLESDKPYALEDLFSKDIKIIIPDLQRDYCWGDAQHGKNKQELVSDFLKSLIDSFKKDSELLLQLGMIYAYENPTNHIQLCDGQQRITTLYLLMGMLHRAVNEPIKEQLKQCLISDFEWNEDDKECRLQYAIRDSTLYFLNDLVSHFFILDKGNTLKVADIEKQSWFFNEYLLDPSIQSIQNALKIIEGELAEKSLDKGLFATFLIKQVKLLYFDIEDRQRGEDIFVIINTTGEPLTPSEQLKPILLGDLDNSSLNELNKEWEKRETYFWENRKSDEVEADNGVKHFLEWFLKIRKQTDSVDLIKDFKAEVNKADTLAKINLYFLEILTLIKVLQNPVFKSISNNEITSFQHLRTLDIKIQQNILLPLFAYIVKFKKIHAPALLRRLRKNYYDKEIKERNNNYIDWRYILKIVEIVEKSQDLETILTFNSSLLGTIQNVKLNVWYNEEEQWKKQLKINHKVLIEKWEDHVDFMGDLTPLKSVSDTANDIEKLEHYYKTYCFVKDIETGYANNELRNRYFLNKIYQSPSWYHGSIGGYGYYLLSLDNKLLHLQDGFYKVWCAFDEHYNLVMEKLNENAVTNFLKEQNKLKLSNISQTITGQKDASKIIEIDTNNKIYLYYKAAVELWLYLEMLHHINQRIDFKQQHKVSNFWDWKQNLNFTNEELAKAEKYPIGNWTCGACFKNKKEDFNYQCYELMKRANEQYKKYKNASIEKQLEIIKENTEYYQKLISDELNT